MRNAVLWVQTYFERRELNRAYRRKEDPPYLDKEAHRETQAKRRVDELHQLVASGDVTYDLNWMVRELAATSVGYQLLPGPQSVADSTVDRKLDAGWPASLVAAVLVGSVALYLLVWQPSSSVEPRQVSSTREQGDTRQVDGTAETASTLAGSGDPATTQSGSLAKTQPRDAATTAGESSLAQADSQDATSVARAAPKESPDDAVLLVLVEEPATASAWPFGSAAAIADRTLLTSATVATGLAEFRDKGWRLWATNQRLGLKVEVAGLEVMDIINEPTAAAIAFGYHRAKVSGRQTPEKPERILVYDLGGGTFDVTILEINGRTFRTLATDGDVQLGGKDFDERLFNELAEKFIEQHGADPRSDERDAAQLWIDVQELKHALSERQKTMVVVFHAGVRMRHDLLERTKATTELVVKQAGLTWKDVDRVLLVGGSTRMPMVARMLRELTGHEPDQSQSADEVVAHGAALYAAMLSDEGPSDRPKFELINVNSHSLGVVGTDNKVGQKVNVVLIRKNTPLPACKVKRFKTAHANQPSVKIRVVEHFKLLLAAESELGSRFDVLRDFLKLVVVRSAVKVLIYPARVRDRDRSIIVGDFNRILRLHAKRFLDEEAQWLFVGIPRYARWIERCDNPHSLPRHVHVLGPDVQNPRLVRKDDWWSWTT